MDGPDRDDLWTLYKTGVEEYRFQVQLNNQRFQWYVGLDVVLVTIGTGLLRLSDRGDGRFLTSLIFLVGVVLAVFTGRAVAQQVTYQREAREQVMKVAAALHIEEFSIRSTGGWKETPAPWWMKVRSLNYSLLAVLAGVNLVGFVYVLAK